MINFELPEILWKVTRAYLTNDVPDKFLLEIISQEKSYYFKDHNLAQEFCDSFSDTEIIEPVSVARSNNEQIVYELKVVAYMERIETKNLIPKVFDL
jgi:hypothetical protein